MTKQPESLRLADEMIKYRITDESVLQTATELRRLHDVNQELVEALKEIIPKNLNLFNNLPDKAVIPMDFTMGEFRKIAAAIAKAKEQA